MLCSSLSALLCDGVRKLFVWSATKVESEVIFFHTSCKNLCWHSGKLISTVLFDNLIWLLLVVYIIKRFLYTVLHLLFPPLGVLMYESNKNSYILNLSFSHLCWLANCFRLWNWAFINEMRHGHDLCLEQKKRAILAPVNTIFQKELSCLNYFGPVDCV